MSIVVLVSAALAGAPTFSPELHVRPRFEADTGEDAAEGGGRLFVVQRSRLGGAVDFGPVLARVAAQDSRVWGTESDPGAVTAPDLDLRLASARITLADGVALTVGRQEIRWHEERLVAIANWQPVGRVFDAVRLDVERGALRAHGFSAIVAEGDADTVDSDGVSAGGHIGYAVEAGSVDGVYLYDTDSRTDRARHTAGLFASGARGPVSGRLEGYVQRGTVDGRSLSAGLLGVQATLAPAVRFAPAVTLWYDWLSGDGDLTDDRSTAFVMVYGAKHKFMGIADIVYYQLGGPDDGLGLHNPALKLRSAPVAGLSLFLDLHTFSAATGAGHIGHEVDLKAAYSLARGVKLSAGCGAFQGAAGRPLDLFAWTMLDVRLQRPE